jgi:hypothetical protein
MGPRLAADLGDAEAATQLLPLLLPHSDQVATAAAMPWGSGDHFLGLMATTVGDLNTADEAFVGAADVHSRLRAPAFLVHTQFEWAGALHKRRRPADTGRANQLLAEAAVGVAAAGYASVISSTGQVGPWARDSRASAVRSAAPRASASAT